MRRLPGEQGEEGQAGQGWQSRAPMESIRKTEFAVPGALTPVLAAWASSGCSFNREVCLSWNTIREPWVAANRSAEHGESRGRDVEGDK